MSRQAAGLRSLDWHLGLGLGGATLLLAAAIYGPLVAPHDSWFAVSLFEGKPPPLPPNSEFPLGTDRLGHDLVSWVLIGARTTLAIASMAAILSLAIGSLGIGVSFWIGALLRRLAIEAATAIAAIPRTIRAIILVMILHPDNGPTAFAIALGLVISPGAYLNLQQMTTSALRATHLDGATAIGASRSRILLRHVLPAIAGAAIVFGGLQFATVLILLGELGLLRVVVGPLARDTDYTGATQIIASFPEWSAMLATTRPIRDLYGDSMQVVAPAGALLFAIITMTLLSDALARRARELDVFRIFSRRESLALAAVIALVVLPVAVWPSRLQAELAYASGFPTMQAVDLHERLAAKAAPYGSLAAEERADILRVEVDGVAVSSENASVAAVSGGLRFGGRAVSLGPGLRSLALFDHQIEAQVLLMDPNPRLLSDPRVSGSAVLMIRPDPDRLGALVAAAAGARAAAVIAVHSRLGAYSSSAATYSLATYVLSEDAAVETMNIRIRPGYPNGLQMEPLGGRVILRTQTSVSSGSVVTTRPQPGPNSSPLVLVLAPYASDDQASDMSGAAAVVATAASYARTAPWPLRLRTIYTPQVSTAVGVKTALSQASDGIRDAPSAVVLLRGASTSTPFAISRPATGSSPPTPAVRLSHRIADAVGTSVISLPTDELSRAVRDAGIAAPLFVLGQEETAQTGANALADTGRTLLVLLAYIAGHRDLAI